MLKKKNNKGQSTIFMIILILVLLFGTILLFIGGILTIKINDALNLNVSLGQVNLAETNALTFGKFNEMYLINADWWGLSLIFGMILGLFLSTYMTRGRFPKWGIIIDIFIILTIFIISLYSSSYYHILLDELANANLTFLEDYTPRTSNFIINLPIYVVVIGVIMMILFHSSIPKKTEERIQEGGYLQGI